MTNEKAMDLLDNLIGMVDDNQENDYDEALKMGITALKNPKKFSREWHKVYMDGWKDGRQKLLQAMEREVAE